MHNSGIYGMNPYIMGPPGCGCCNDYARFKVVADKGGLGCCNEEVGNVKYVRKDHSVWVYDPCDLNATDCGWVCIFSGVSIYDLVDNTDGSFTLTENDEPKTTIDMNLYFQKYFKHNILSKVITLTNGDGNTIDIYDKSYIDGEIDRINNTITNIEGDITNIQSDITNIQGDITNIENNLGDTVTDVTTNLSTSNVLTTTVVTDNGSYSDTTDLSSLSGGGGTGAPDLQAVLNEGNTATGIDTETSISGKGAFAINSTSTVTGDASLLIGTGKGYTEVIGTSATGYSRISEGTARFGSYATDGTYNSSISSNAGGALILKNENGTDSFGSLELLPYVSSALQPYVRIGLSNVSSSSKVFTYIDMNGVKLPNWQEGDLASLPDTHAVSKAQLASISTGGTTPDLQTVLDEGSLSMISDKNFKVEAVDTAGGSEPSLDYAQIFLKTHSSRNGNTQIHAGTGSIEFVADTTTGSESTSVTTQYNDFHLNCTNSSTYANSNIRIHEAGNFLLTTGNGVDSWARIDMSNAVGGTPIISLGVSSIDSISFTKTIIDENGVNLPKSLSSQYSGLPTTHSVSKAQLELVAGGVRDKLTELETLLLEEIRILKERLDSLEKTT